MVIKKWSKNSKPVSFSFKFLNQSFIFNLYDGAPDLATLLETFLFEEYRPTKKIEPKLIIDIGAHNGSTALYFHLLYPNAKIYAVEASKINYDRLVKNVKGIKNILPIHSAICDRNGFIDFFDSKSSIGSSIKKRAQADKKNSVPSTTLLQFFKDNKIDFADLIKIDIEGAEESLFDDTAPEEFCQSYAIEVHEDLMVMSVESYMQKFINFECTRKELDNNRRFILQAMKR